MRLVGPVFDDVVILLVTHSAMQLCSRPPAIYRCLFKGSRAISVRLKYDIGPSSPASDPAISYSVTLDCSLRRRRRRRREKRTSVD